MQDIDQLFDRLNSPDGGTAEAALARLTVLGARMVEPLLARYPAAPEAMRPRLLLLLERCPDFRAVPLLRMEILSPSLAIRRQAVRALGRMDRASTARLLLDTLKREHSTEVRVDLACLLAQRAMDGGAMELLDPLLERLFDQEEDREVRRTVLPVLACLKSGQIQRLLRRLAESPGDPLAADALALLDSGGDPREIIRLPRGLWNEAPLNHPDSRLQPASLNPSIMPQRPQAGPPGDNLDETARGRFPAPAGTPATPNGPPLPRLDPGWPIPVLEEILQSMENPTDRRILLALKHLARGLDERRRGEADTDRAARLAHLAARAHLLIAQAGSRLAIADLKEALRQPGQHQTELIQAFREMGTAEDLPDLLAAHLRAGSRLKAQIREAVMAIHHRSDAHRLKRSCRALSAQQNAQLLRLLASTSGSGSKMAAGESP